MEVRKVVIEAGKQLGVDLKNEQIEAVELFVRKMDVFVILPTGYGKSMCYACLPLVFDAINSTKGSIAVVISPLIAIIKDQTKQMNEIGISAGYVCDEDTDTGRAGDTEAMQKRIMDGELQLVYFTPESIMRKRRWHRLLSSRIYQKKTIALVIDEAHCVESWGHSFCSALLQLGELRSYLPPSVNVMALTATCPKSLKKKLSVSLNMTNVGSVIRSPCKANIFYSVYPFTTLEMTFETMLAELLTLRCCFPRTIMYCRTYQDCSNLYLFFKHQMGPSFTEPVNAPVTSSKFRLVEMFASCTPTSVKNQIISSFTTESILRVVISTLAFGMGVDCHGVTQIIHVGASDSLENYIQETGRAGRDGTQAQAILLKKKNSCHNITDSMKEYMLTKIGCRRELLFSDMEGYCHQPLDIACLCCDICRRKCIKTECVYHAYKNYFK